MIVFSDGNAIDLGKVQVACDGTRWLWTCDFTEYGDPFMANLANPRLVLPLPTVIRGHGPIAPERHKPTTAECRQVLEAAS
ncbi:hypothetical protein F7R91_14355 [Streptomyces luteolifulvus]|uniref:Uncharacterized protein n=1 Tax=Streptomyces luteolifulvus TaxID=2615112 RepID=A0A6H9V239_9ACTN|nr:phiSA1p31-related protein [Streptomyces luteolifulvus]KAB1146758.1 hypothetical protein F7R91_14355 [Streptomyces luteolifulvus]